MRARLLYDAGVRMRKATGASSVQGGRQKLSEDKEHGRSEEHAERFQLHTTDGLQASCGLGEVNTRQERGGARRDDGTTDGKQELR